MSANKTEELLFFQIKTPQRQYTAGIPAVAALTPQRYFVIHERHEEYEGKSMHCYKCGCPVHARHKPRISVTNAVDIYDKCHGYL